MVGLSLKVAKPLPSSVADEVPSSPLSRTAPPARLWPESSWTRTRTASSVPRGTDGSPFTTGTVGEPAAVDVTETTEVVVLYAPQWAVRSAVLLPTFSSPAVTSASAPYCPSPDWPAGTMKLSVVHIDSPG